MDGSAAEDRIREALAVTRRFVAARFPGAEAALLAGSRARGEGGPRSDYDVFLLLRHLPEGAWRGRSVFEGKAFEIFAHDSGTFAYFCRAVVGGSGVPSVPEMVADGIAVCGDGSAALASARALAVRTLASGPPPLDPAVKRHRLSALTELVGALADCPPGPAMTAVGGALYPMLADFALRSAGAWSASVKRLPGALARLDPALGESFASAFSALFAGGDPEPVVALAESILAPHGPPPRDGFRIPSPPHWRD